MYIYCIILNPTMYIPLVVLSTVGRLLQYISAINITNYLPHTNKRNLGILS